MGETSGMYSSLDRVEFVLKDEAGTIVAQVVSDHRDAAEIEAAPELSVLFALTRVLMARAYANSQGFATQVNYVVIHPLPAFFRTALAAAGAVVTNLATEQRIHLPTVTLTPAGLAENAFRGLAAKVGRHLGQEDNAALLRALERETLVAPVDKERDEIAYWTRVFELAAVFGELMRSQTGGRWIASSATAERTAIPFGLTADGLDGGVVVFPTNRAQRLLAGDDEASLFGLLRIDEARAAHEAQVAVLPSLRDRTEAMNAGMQYRALLPYTPASAGVPVIAYGTDSPEMFGPILASRPQRAEVLHAKALANLAAVEVTVEILRPSLLSVTGSYFAADKLLDAAFMRTLHARLDSERLAVGVPRRGLMLVAALRSEDPREASELGELTLNECVGEQRISSSLVLVQGGDVIRHLDPTAVRDPEPPAATPSPAKPGWFRRVLGRN